MDVKKRSGPEGLDTHRRGGIMGPSLPAGAAGAEGQEQARQSGQLNEERPPRRPRNDEIASAE
ncbi:hypothetical protein GCM10009681_50940 [Luedemannella helvata]|uniref:Uncharacterized protein n=1 Tax=Luedemannella helvata TaxID=349315 RepID=A0ABN2L362_9ACTN